MVVQAFVDETTNMSSEEYDSNIDDVIQRKDEILDDYDLPILPAHNDGFNETFLEEDCWHDVRIKKW